MPVSIKGSLSKIALAKIGVFNSDLISSESINFLRRVEYCVQRALMIRMILLSHATGTSINFALCEEIINSDIPYIMVVYEKIFGNINK